MKWEKELELAVQAAREAGALLRNGFTASQKILAQTRGDIKLQADRDAERLILDVLAATPYAVLAEETGEHGAVQEPHRPYWVVDPLDGTMNFSRQIPQCVVSIALNQGERALLGVIYDFNCDELFTGVPGHAAKLNGAAMTVSGVREATGAILSTSFTALVPDGAAVHPRMRSFRKTRMFGSAALSLAYVACGRVDAYADDEIMLWDVAAGLALIEAGGGFTECLPGHSRWSRRVRCASHRAIWYS